MNILIPDICKVWDIQDEGNVLLVKLSCSRKVNEKTGYDKIQIEKGVAKNGYISTPHNFVRFVGHAKNKLLNVKIGDAITNLKGRLEKEPFWDEKSQSIAYPKYYKITVFDFELFNGTNGKNNQTKNLDMAPQVEDNQTENTNYVENNTNAIPKAEDVCPF